MIPFVIASRSRCGSHMLRSALDSHADIQCLPECFHPKFFGSRSASEHLAGLFDGTKVASGFLLLHWTSNGKAIGETDPDFFDARRLILRQHPGLRVIILYRQNLLERFLSQKLTGQFGRYHVTHPSQIQAAAPVTVDPAEMLNSFRIHDGELDDDRRAYQRQATCEVSYESLVASWSHETRNILQFLSVAETTIQSRFFKQSHYGHVRNVIANYGEVISAIRKSPWAASVERWRLE